MIINVQLCSFVHKNICCGYTLETPRRGDSNEYPQHGEALLKSTHNTSFFFMEN